MTGHWKDFPGTPYNIYSNTKIRIHDHGDRSHDRFIQFTNHLENMEQMTLGLDQMVLLRDYLSEEIKKMDRRVSLEDRRSF